MGCLVLLSLVLITLSFRSSALDPVQSYGASVLRPFEVAANRVARAVPRRGELDARPRSTPSPRTSG